ncbi:MAG: gas vesicle protein GvpG [Deltaproteobacteria bacterium]|nr:gas vesicle protein GvpG [Deltaproteobacteria bacterium]
MLLIDDLLMLPVKGFLGIFKKIHEMVEQELSDETYLLEKMMALRLRFELDEISEEEYSQQERELLARLDAARGVDEAEKEEVFKYG